MNCVEYVVFSLDKAEYGIEISFAQEIMRIPQKIIKMPDMPSYIEGIINLRGKVVPIISLDKRFNLGQAERNNDSRLLILDLRDMLLGVIVDDVSEVLKIDEQSIEKFDFKVSGIGRNSVKGIGKVGERLIILLDVIKMKAEVFQINNDKESVT